MEAASINKSAKEFLEPVNISFFVIISLTAFVVTKEVSSPGGIEVKGFTYFSVSPSRGLAQCSDFCSLLKPSPERIRQGCGARVGS